MPSHPKSRDRELQLTGSPMRKTRASEGPQTITDVATPGLTPTSIQRLQQSAGNRAVAGLLVGTPTTVQRIDWPWAKKKAEPDTREFQPDDLMKNPQARALFRAHAKTEYSTENFDFMDLYDSLAASPSPEKANALSKFCTETMNLSSTAMAQIKKALAEGHNDQTAFQKAQEEVIANLGDTHSRFIAKPEYAQVRAAIPREAEPAPAVAEAPKPEAAPKASGGGMFSNWRSWFSRGSTSASGGKAEKKAPAPKAYSVDELMGNAQAWKAFSYFASSEHSEENIYFIEAVEGLRNMTTRPGRVYWWVKTKDALNISGSSKTAVMQKWAEGERGAEIFEPALHDVQTNLKDTLSRFRSSAGYSAATSSLQ